MKRCTEERSTRAFPNGSCDCGQSRLDLGLASHKLSGSPSPCALCVTLRVRLAIRRALGGPARYSGCVLFICAASVRHTGQRFSFGVLVFACTFTLCLKRCMLHSVNFYNLCINGGRLTKVHCLLNASIVFLQRIWPKKTKKKGGAPVSVLATNRWRDRCHVFCSDLACVGLDLGCGRLGSK